LYKTKIAIIGAKNLPATGGASRSVEYLLSSFVSDYTVTVYLLEESGLDGQIINKLNIIKVPNLVGKRLRTMSYYLFSMFHALIKGSYDIVFVQHLYSGFIIPLLNLRFKTVLTVHGIIPKDDAKWSQFDKLLFRSIERIFSVSANKLVSVSKIDIPYLESLSKRHVEYIPNCVEIKHNRSVKYSSRINRITFSAARIIPLKGCHIMLEALEDIFFSGEIIIIGDIDQIPSYRDELIRLSLNLNVHFRGLITDQEILFNEIYNSDLFVFPSFSEGLSNMLLEVASLGIPIVASNIPANTEIFDSDEVVFFESGNVNSLSTNLKRIINGEVGISNNARQAQIKIIENYTSTIIGKEYKRLFDSISPPK
jgi:glycosyltransferase involved in cell wall biosynthesis